MALGRGGAGSVPDYIGMSQDASQSGMNEAKSMAGLLDQGYKLGGQVADRTRRDQARAAIGQAWADGSPEAIDRAMQMFPEYAKQMQDMIGVKDEQHRKDVGSMSAQLHALLSSGNIDGAKDLVARNAHLFEKEGPFSAQGVIGMMDDPKKLQGLDNWAQSATIGTLSPLEILKHYDSVRGLDLREQGQQNQLQLGQQRIGLQAQLGAQRNQLGWANLKQRTDFQNQTHLDRIAALDAKNAESSFTNLITPDGTTHKIRMNPRTGGYANHDTKGNPIDVDGKVLNLTANAGMQSGGADALRVLNVANTLSNDSTLKGKGGNNIAARLYKSIDPTGHYTDIQSKYDAVNKGVAAAIAVRLTQESGGFAPKQAEVEAGIQSAGKLSLDNSAEQNREILERQKGILHNVYENSQRNEATGTTGTADEQFKGGGTGNSVLDMSDDDLLRGLQ